MDLQGACYICRLPALHLRTFFLHYPDFTATLHPKMSACSVSWLQSPPGHSQRQYRHSGDNKPISFLWTNGSLYIIEIKKKITWWVFSLQNILPKLTIHYACDKNNPSALQGYCLEINFHKVIWVFMYNLRIMEIIQIMRCQGMQHKVTAWVNALQRDSGRPAEARPQRTWQESGGQGPCTTSFRTEWR